MVNKKIIASMLWLIVIFTIFRNTNEISHFLNNLSYGLAIFLYGIIYIVSIILILPCTYLTIISGVIFGFKYGFIFTLLFNIIGAYLTYKIGGRCLKKVLLKDPKIPYSIRNNHYLIGFFFGINPILPGPSLGYLASKLKLNLVKYLIGSTIGSAPLIFIIIYISDEITN